MTEDEEEDRAFVVGPVMMLVDGEGGIGYYNSLELGLDPTGRPHISYWGSGVGLRYAFRAADGGWVTEEIDLAFFRPGSSVLHAYEAF